MQDLNKTEEGCEHSQTTLAPFAEAQELLFAIDLQRIEASLSAAVGDSVPISKALADAMTNLEVRARMRYAHIWTTKLPWWSYLRTPISAFRFLIARKRADLYVSPVEHLEEIDQLLGHSQFSAMLASGYRAHLRLQIKQGKISRWSAMSMVRSLGCQVTTKGELLPSPISKGAIVAGSFVSLVVFALFAIFSTTAIAELLGPCVRGCVLLGSLEITAILAYSLLLANQLTFGRQRAAKRVRQLIGVM